MKQRKMLSQAFGNARFIYNWGLNRKKESWEKDKKNVTFLQLCKELTLLKQDGEHDWLKDCANVCLQQSLRNLDSAYKRFFKEKKGFPKFKSKKFSRDSVKFIGSVHFDFEKRRVSVPRVGKVKFFEHQTFDVNEVKLGTLTVSRDKCGDYWCTIVVDDSKPQVSKAKICEETAVGIDLGIKDYAILSDGTKYHNPKFLEREQNHLAVLQQRFAKTQKGSRRREKAKLKIAKLHRRIRDKRVDYLHKLTTDIVRKYDTVCLEDLNIEGMLQNHCLAMAISSVAWNEFVRQLKYKSEWHGKNVVMIGRFEPSSRKCSVCGYVNKELTLKDREWTCPECGGHHDRDVNAARNIKALGLSTGIGQKAATCQ
ncbi:MAG: transposase [Bacteroidales bacterium]|nr:transposase [Bacteroidales bacterium]